MKKELGDISRYDSDNNPCFADLIYVPANRTLRYSCKVKCDPDFSGTRPYLGVVDVRRKHLTQNTESGVSATKTINGQEKLNYSIQLSGINRL